MVATPQADFAVISRADLAHLLRLAKQRHEFWGHLRAIKHLTDEFFMDYPE